MSEAKIMDGKILSCLHNPRACLLSTTQPERIIVFYFEFHSRTGDATRRDTFPFEEVNLLVDCFEQF